MNYDQLTDEEKLKKSEEIAGLITFIKMALQNVDFEFIQYAANQFEQDADRYDSCAVLNRNWNQHGASLKITGAKQLRALADFIKYGLEYDQLKQKANQHQEQINAISKMFQL